MMVKGKQMTVPIEVRIEKNEHFAVADARNQAELLAALTALKADGYEMEQVLTDRWAREGELKTDYIVIARKAR
jgi:hypothetical protein